MLFSPLSGYLEGVVDREVEQEAAVGRIGRECPVPRDPSDAVAVGRSERFFISEGCRVSWQPFWTA
jgi:hypothetical protein